MKMTRGAGDEAMESWREEMQSAWLYRVLADCERDPGRAELFRALARAADAQARQWHRVAARKTEEPPAFAPTLRARLVAALVRAVGARPLRPVLAAMKVRGLSSFGSRTPMTHPMPSSVEDVGARHRGLAAGNIRAAVFGVNDGLVSNLSLIMGVAGATNEPRFVLVAGAAGLLAGALSMAAGEWVSVRSQRELYESQIELERKELEQYPEEEAEELALIYAARGMTLDEARHVARAMMRSPRHALDVLAREELGLDPDELANPWSAAGFSFVSFALGALVPLLPFTVADGGIAALWAACLSAVALFGVGSAISLFTGRTALASGLRMLAIGAAAAGATHALGRLLGVSL